MSEIINVTIRCNECGKPITCRWLKSAKGQRRLDKFTHKCKPKPSRHIDERKHYGSHAQVGNH